MLLRRFLVFSFFVFKIIYLCYNFTEYDDRGCNMKKGILLFTLFISFLGLGKVDALCYDQELNDWAVKVKIKHTDFDKYLVDEETGKEIVDLGYDYSYILSLDTPREDVVMKATNNYDEKLEGKYVPGHKLYGIVNYTAPYSIKYEITIYGGENSACPNEVLKKMEYELEPFNYYHKTELCENYPEAPLCAIYKDTEDMTQEEFQKEMEQYIEKVEGPKPDPWYKVIWNIFTEYIIYILVPFILIAAVYTLKIEKVKREERDK